MKVTVEEASRDLRSYIDRAAAGESIFIEENGKVLAAIVSQEPATSRLLTVAKQRGWRLPSRPKRHSSEFSPIKSVVAKTAAEMVIEDRR